MDGSKTSKLPLFPHNGLVYDNINKDVTFTSTTHRGVSFTLGNLALGIANLKYTVTKVDDTIAGAKNVPANLKVIFIF